VADTRMPGCECCNCCGAAAEEGNDERTGELAWKRCDLLFVFFASLDERRARQSLFLNRLPRLVCTRDFVFSASYTSESLRPLRLLRLLRLLPILLRTPFAIYWMRAPIELVFLTVAVISVAVVASPPS
jgi:hypothetical protein